MKMKHTFKNENGHLDAEVSFSKEEVSKASDKAVNKLIANVVVPGFRKGKAPKELASRYLHNDDVANETVNALLRMLDKNFEADEEFSKYVKDGKFAQSLRPEVSLKKFSADEAEFLVTYFLAPSVKKLGDYKGLTTSVKQKRILVKDVEEEINHLAKDNAELVPSDKEAEMGDTVNIDFTGLMDGKPFDGGSATSFDLELGSKHFVPGFEEQCVSHKAGDKFDVALTMPDNYPEPLTSKPVVFKVTLNAVKTKEVPEINDEFATTLSGQYVSKNLDELKAKVKENLTRQSFNTYKNAVVNDLLLQVREGSEFEICPEYIQSLLQSRKEQDENQIEQQGLSLEEYLKLVNQTMEQYEANLKTGLENEIKSSLIYQAVAKAEDIKAPTKEDIEKQIGSPMDEFVKNFANYYRAQKMSDDQINNQINGYINQVFSSIMTGNVQARLLELNVPELIKKEEKLSAEKEEKKEEKKEEAKEEAKAE